MIVRGQHPEAVIWPRFRAAGDGFAFGTRGTLFEAHLYPNADRSVELYLAVLEHFAPAVEVRVEDWRTGLQWRGDRVANADVRDAVARSKHALAARAGVELTVVGNGEQATLTANLELWVYAPTDRWLYLLQGKGLRRVRQLRRRSWRLLRGEFEAMASDEQSAARLIAERLTLEPGAPDRRPTAGPPPDAL